MPRAVRVRPVSVGAKAAKPWLDVRTRQGVAQTAEGDLLVKLLPGEPVMLRTAAVAGRPPTKAPPTRWGQTPTARSVPSQTGPVPTEEELFSGLFEWFSANSPNVSTDAYWVDVATVEAVDLSRAALYTAILFRQFRRLHEQIDCLVFVSEMSRRSFLAAPNTDGTLYVDYAWQMRGPRRRVQISSATNRLLARICGNIRRAPEPRIWYTVGSIL